MPQAQFLRPAPRRRVFVIITRGSSVNCPSTKLTKPETRLTGSSVCCKSAAMRSTAKGEQADAGRDNVSTLSSPSPLITCASSVWRLLSQPSEIHSAIGRINKLSTWLIGRMQAGDAGVNIPAKPQCPAGATARSTLARRLATVEQRHSSGYGSRTAARHRHCVLQLVKQFAHLPVRQPEN